MNTFNNLSAKTKLKEVQYFQLNNCHMSVHMCPIYKAVSGHM